MTDPQRDPPTNLLAPGLFEGQTAFVTGGGTGLGLAVSTRLGGLGANIVCASRDTAHHDRLLEPKGFKAVIDIALNGVFFVSREVGRRMRKTGGTIVNISAPYAATGKPGVVHSACAKAGVDAMTRSLASEWAPYGIRVNAVSPGPFVSTGAADRLWPSEEIERAVIAQIPLGRFASAEEVGELVCLLASKATPWVTGAIWLADGGWTLPTPMVDEETVKMFRRRPKSGTSSAGEAAPEEAADGATGAAGRGATGDARRRAEES